MRRPLAVLLFLAAVVAFTFLSTVVHELGHALAWDPDEAPDFIVSDSRDSARQAVSSEKAMIIDGRPYRVVEVERTTIALYPKSILATGLTLGLAPAGLLPDPVLASTFYALEEEHYAALAAGEHPTGWEEAATPMIVNGFLAIPVWIWLMWRPNAVSMAAAWSNAAEWRYNVHHAEEVGIPSALYLGASLLVMAITAGVITFMAVGAHRTPIPAGTGRPGHVPSVRGHKRPKPQAHVSPGQIRPAAVSPRPLPGAAPRPPAPAPRSPTTDAPRRAVADKRRPPGAADPRF